MGSLAVDAARRTGDRPTLIHTLKTSLWHGLTPDLATVQLARSTELARLCTEAGDREVFSVASFHRAIVSYLAGRPDDLVEAMTDLHRAAEAWTALAHLLRRLPRPGAGVPPGRLRAGRAAGRGEPAARARPSVSTAPTAPTACRCS